MVATWYVILGFMMGDLGAEDELSFEGKIFFVNPKGKKLIR